ncbi:hypothetical protein H4R33_003758 [Dimargaris cristalligena]|nr:hypothetical protein H4R33_003758 [Dimargaris cristalligena]
MGLPHCIIATPFPTQGSGHPSSSGSGGGYPTGQTLALPPWEAGTSGTIGTFNDEPVVDINFDEFFNFMDEPSPLSSVSQMDSVYDGGDDRTLIDNSPPPFTSSSTGPPTNFPFNTQKHPTDTNTEAGWTNVAAGLAVNNKRPSVDGRATFPTIQPRRTISHSLLPTKATPPPVRNPPDQSMEALLYRTLAAYHGAQLRADLAKQDSAPSNAAESDGQQPLLPDPLPPKNNKRARLSFPPTTTPAQRLLQPSPPGSQSTPSINIPHSTSPDVLNSPYITPNPLLPFIRVRWTNDVFIFDQATFYAGLREAFLKPFDLEAYFTAATHSTNPAPRSEVETLTVFKTLDVFENRLAIQMGTMAQIAMQLSSQALQSTIQEVFPTQVKTDLLPTEVRRRQAMYKVLEDPTQSVYLVYWDPSRLEFGFAFIYHPSEGSQDFGRFKDQLQTQYTLVEVGHMGLGLYLPKLFENRATEVLKKNTEFLRGILKYKAPAS